MTASLDPGVTWWEDEGRRVAALLREVSAVLVCGTNVEHAARVALAIAREESGHRHVALGDLTGDAAPLYAIAGGEDAFGLADCLRQGLPLNDIARRAPDGDSLFILPAGSPPVACHEILAHERWRGLVNGFTKVGALLLLVVTPDAPGLEALAAATDGVVLAGTVPPRALRFHVLAAIATPEPAEPPALRRAPPRRAGRFAATAILALVTLAAAAWLGRGGLLRAYRAASARRGGPAPVVPAARAVPPAAPTPTPTLDTVRLAEPVNPSDPSSTSPFAVEVMAANTLAGANSFLAEHARTAPLGEATVSPVSAGGSSSVWYQVVVGASHDRAGADSLLALLHREGLVQRGQGRVVNVPYALLLADSVEGSNAGKVSDAWRRRGFNAYRLLQKNGSVRVLAGAFESPAQAAPLAAALRAARVAPVVVFRTGRTY